MPKKELADKLRTQQRIYVIAKSADLEQPLICRNYQQFR